MASSTSMWLYARILSLAHAITNVVIFAKNKHVMQIYDKVLFGVSIFANVVFWMLLMSNPIYAVQSYVFAHATSIITSVSFIVTCTRARDNKKHAPDQLADVLPLWIFTSLGMMVLTYGLLPGTMLFQTMAYASLVAGYYVAQQW